MASLRLLKSHTLPITRTGDELDKGYYDAGGKWVNPTTTLEFDVVGNLQPFKPYQKQEVLPEGTRTSDTRVFYTKEELRTCEQYNNLSADKTIINSKVYTVFMVMPWTGFGLTPDHHTYILIMDNPK